MTAPINFADLMKQSKGQLEPIPDGDYDVKVIDAQAVQASTGSPMIKTKLEITSGPHVKRKVYWNATLSVENPMALAIFFRNMNHLGLNDAFFASQPTMDQVADALMNRPARVTLNRRTWQGVERNEVKAVLPPLATGGPVAPGTVTGPAAPVPSAGAVPAANNIPNPTAGPQIPNPTAAPTTPATSPTVGTTPTVKNGPPAPPVPAF